MAGETMEYKITVDADQAQGEIKKFDLSFKTLAEKAKAADWSLKGVQSAAQNLQSKLGPTAAAISGIASAMGETNGETGKFIAAAGQVAAAFAAGGPYAAGLVAGIALVDRLGKAWEDELKAQDAALKAQYASLDTAVTRLEKAKGQLDAIVASSMPKEWQISAEERKKLADVDLVIAENQASLAKIVDKVKTDARRAEIAGLELAIKKNEQERQAIIDTAEAQRKAIRDAKADADSAAFVAKMKADKDKADADAKAAKDAEKRDKSITDSMKKSYDERLKIIKDFVAEKEDVESERIKVSLSAPFAGSGKLFGQSAGIGGTLGPQGEMQALAVEAAKNAAMAEDWSLAWKRAGNDVADSLGGATGAMTKGIGIAVAGIEQLTTDVITGQEHATERLGVLVMSQAGQSLIASGTDLAGRAVVSAFTPGLQPLAVTQGAAAASLIAAGIGLGGAASGLEHVTAGGTIGKPLPDKAKKDGGASPRSSRGGGGDGGPLVINVSYGVGGPLPEDTAREISRVMRTGDRRRGAA